MNILLLTNKLPYPPRDGGSIATLNMAIGLADRGARVSMLAINTSKHHFEPGELPVHIREKISIRAVSLDTGINPVNLLCNLLFSGQPYNATRFRSRKVTGALEELLAETRFDVVQLEGPYLYYCIPLVRAGSKALVSLRAHNIEHEIWQRNAALAAGTVRGRYLRVLAGRIEKLERELLGRIDLLVPISTRDAARFREIDPMVEQHVCLFGLTLPDYLPEPRPAEFSLFFIGALDWLPNTDGLNWFLAHVWPGIRKRLPGLRFHIAGRNAAEYYRQNIRDPRIILEGEVDDARKFMAEHAVMIVPLFSGSGIRVKILEGMAMGKAIISTSIGAEGINARHGEEILLADDPAAFQEAIEELAGKPRLMEDMAVKAREFVRKNFDNLVVCKELTEFYKGKM